MTIAEKTKARPQRTRLKKKPEHWHAMTLVRLCPSRHRLKKETRRLLSIAFPAAPE